MTATLVDAEFEDVVGPFRRELLAHCYRMSGSVVDAEDLLQETLVRAWKGRSGFRGDASARTWLHRIATNVCLTFLEGRPRRPLPTGLGTADSDPADELVENREVPWLQPLPTPDPADAAVGRETLTLAFVAAIQLLPDRQRAALVLKDCLAWSTAEIAEAVGVSTATVNSLLQRARATLAEARGDGRLHEDRPGTGAVPEELVRRYVAAFEAHDADAIAALFTDDAVWEMPPFTGWYVGPERISRLAMTACPAREPGDLALLPVVANGMPAFATYMRGEGGVHRPLQIHAIAGARGDRVTHLVAFGDDEVFRRFDVPETLER